MASETNFRYSGSQRSSGKEASFLGATKLRILWLGVLKRQFTPFGQGFLLKSFQKFEIQTLNQIIVRDREEAFRALHLGKLLMKTSN